MWLESRDCILGVFCLLVPVIVISVITLALVALLTFPSAYRKARMINATFSTNYSMLDILLAEDVIKELIEGKKLRVEMKEIYEKD